MGPMEASESSIVLYMAIFVSLIGYGLIFAISAGFPFLKSL